MIYVMSEKFFVKNAKKLAKPHDYFGLDGANYSVIAGTSNKEPIASRYNRFHSVGSFCPETRLYRYLRKMKNDEEYNQDRYEKEVREFLRDKSFISAVRTALMAEISNYPYALNIFVVLPNLVWKYLGDEITERIKNISKMEFEFVYTQRDIKEKGTKILSAELDTTQLKEIDHRIRKIDKKYDLKFLLGDDDD